MSDLGGIYLQNIAKMGYNIHKNVFIYVYIMQKVEHGLLTNSKFKKKFDRTLVSVLARIQKFKHFQ